MNKKNIKIPEESIIKTDEEHVTKLILELREYNSKLCYVIQQQHELIVAILNMMMQNKKLKFDARWFCEVDDD